MGNNLPTAYKDKNSLKEYLRLKGKNHNCYKHYGNVKRIENIIKNKEIYLSRGDNWNDVRDKTRFNALPNIVNFGTCFSFSKEESVAMWMLYGGIKKSGAMIDFTKKGISSILNVNSISVGYFESKFEELVKLDRDQFDIYMMDVIYYREMEKGIYIKRGDEKGYLKNNIKTKDSNYFKTYPWNYECECRLIVSVDKSVAESNLEIATNVRISLEGLDLGKSFERIYKQPGFKGTSKLAFRQSSLSGEIDWDLH